MSIITISRGSYSRGKEVAEKVAAILGYECISRDILLEASEEFNIPEIKLIRALHDSPSVLERFTYGKERYVSYIRKAFLQHVQKDNIVYHGLAGHYFLPNIPHVFKIRIIADIKERVKEEVRRENISEEKARYILKKDDEERRKWGMFLYGIDIMNPEAYNLILRIGHLSEDEAVDIIAKAATLPAFQETAESRSTLVNSAMAALVCRKLFDFPSSVVTAEDGTVRISLKAPQSQQAVIHDRIDQILSDLEGLKKFTVQFEPYF